MRSKRTTRFFIASKFACIFNLKAHVWVQVVCPTSQLRGKYMWWTPLWHRPVWHPLRPVALTLQVGRDLVGLSGLFLSLTVSLHQSHLFVSSPNTFSFFPLPTDLKRSVSLDKRSTCCLANLQQMDDDDWVSFTVPPRFSDGSFVDPV